MKDLCTTCKKRAKCKTLCQKALKYADQDLKESRELVVGKIKYLNHEEIWPEPRIRNEKILVYEMHFIDKLSANEIAFHTIMTEEDVLKIINKLKDSVTLNSPKKKDNILRLHFLEGYTLTQSARIVGVSKPYSHDVIREHLGKCGVI